MGYLPVQDWKRWGVISIGSWLMVATFIGLITTFTEWQMSGELPLLNSMIFEWLCIIPWIIATPLIYTLAKKYPLYRQFSGKGALMHLGGFLFVVTIHNLGQSGVVFWFYDYPVSWEYLRRDWIGFLDMRLMLYGTALAIFWAIHSFQNEQQAKLKEAQLEAELEKAKTDTAHNLMQPQLIIRSLQSIREALRKGNVQEAERQLTKLSDVLRSLLRRYKQQEQRKPSGMGSEHELLLKSYMELLRTQYQCSIQLPQNIDSILISDQRQADQLLTHILNNTEQLLEEASLRKGASISQISLRSDLKTDHQLEICVVSTKAYTRAISLQGEEVAV